jgi:recombination protein RecA
MSSAVVSTPAALGRPFVFDDDNEAEVGSLASASRAALDRTAEGGCPHINPSLAHLQSAISNQKSKISPARVTPASQLDIRPAPEMVSSGAPAIDALTGGLPRGCLTEICGPASSGRTTLLLAALAAATRRGEFCAVVDASDALDPRSAAAAGVELERMLWVRCGEDALRKNSSPQRHRDTEKNGNQKTGCPISRAPFAREVGVREACSEFVERVEVPSVRGVGVPSQPAFNFDPNGSRETGSKENCPRENSPRQSDHRLEQVLRATDLLLESGGFGLIVLDLGDLPPQSARHIPLTTWFRFRRAVEYTPTILLAIEQHPIAGSCSSLLLQLAPPNRREEAIMLNHSDSSREAAAFISPGRKSGVRQKTWSKSQRDDTLNETPIFHPSHAHLLTGLEITAELIRSRLDRKPSRSVAFATKTAWAG